MTSNRVGPRQQKQVVDDASEPARRILHDGNRRAILLLITMRSRQCDVRLGA